jgi:hypothetical protein
MTPETRYRLVQEFRSLFDVLGRLLGRDLSARHALTDRRE